MDDPNVNWVFFDTLEEYWKTEDPNAPALLNNGSFWLHVLQNDIGMVFSKNLQLCR